MSMLEVMDGSGDTKILWSRDNPDEVEVARTAFNSLRAKKFNAFKIVGKDGSQGEQITEFDPNLERIIMVPAMRGG